MAMISRLRMRSSGGGEPQLLDGLLVAAERVALGDEGREEHDEGDEREEKGEEHLPLQRALRADAGDAHRVQALPPVPRHVDERHGGRAGRWR